MTTWMPRRWARWVPPTDGYGPEDNFRETQIANGLSRTPHTLRFDVTFVPGPANDIVKVFLDGTQVIQGTTWEDYYRWTQGTGGPEQTCTCFASRATKTLLFRSGGSAVPANAGNGFLVDNVSDSSGLADLKVGLTAPATVRKKHAMTYTARVTNFGPATANGVGVILVVPPSGFGVTSHSVGVAHPGSFVWSKTYPTIAAGQTVTFTVTGLVGKLKNKTVLQAFVAANATNPGDPSLFTNLQVVSTRVGSQ